VYTQHSTHISRLYSSVSVLKLAVQDPRHRTHKAVGRQVEQLFTMCEYLCRFPHILPWSTVSEHCWNIRLLIITFSQRKDAIFVLRQALSMMVQVASRTYESIWHVQAQATIHETCTSSEPHLQWQHRAAEGKLQHEHCASHLPHFLPFIASFILQSSS
jgi:hypothetical protein